MQKKKEFLYSFLAKEKVQTFLTMLDQTLD